MKAVFLDRDGTVIAGIPTYERIDSVEKVELLPNTLEALEKLARMNYQVFFVTNQAGIAEGLITLQQFGEINNKVLSLIEPSGINIKKTFLCPHGEKDNCDCRKPKPKLLLDAAAEYNIDLTNSWMIGDRPSDVMTGINAGVKTILVKTGDPTAESAEATFTAPSLLEAVEYIDEQSGEIPKLSTITIKGVESPVRYIETLPVKDGVACDTYTFLNDTTRDLAIVRVEAGYKTPFQKVLAGDMTIEGFISGKGTLFVTPKDGEEVGFEFADGSVNEPIVVEIGDTMQWFADADIPLVFYEICSPPYAEGRFEDLPEPETEPAVDTEAEPES